MAGEQRDGARAGGAEARGGVGEAGAGEPAEDAGEHLHRPLARPPHRVVADAGEPGSEHEVVVGESIDQLRDGRRVVLPVGVDLHHVREALRQRVLEARAHRAAHPEVDRQPQHGRPRRLRHAGGRVARTVVDDENGCPGHLREHLAHHVAHGLLLVVRGHHDERTFEGGRHAPHHSRGRLSGLRRRPAPARRGCAPCGPPTRRGARRGRRPRDARARARTAARSPRA